MTKRVFSFIVIAAALAIFMPQNITASAGDLNCRVPFSFVVNGKTLPAGTYAIDAHSGTVIVRGFQHPAIIMGIGASRPASRSGMGSVVFLRTGDRYELIEVWNADGSGREFQRKPWTKEEKARLAATPSERIVISAM